MVLIKTSTLRHYFWCGTPVYLTLPVPISASEFLSPWLSSGGGLTARAASAASASTPTTSWPSCWCHSTRSATSSSTSTTTGTTTTTTTSKPASARSTPTRTMWRRPRRGAPWPWSRWRRWGSPSSHRGNTGTLWLRLIFFIVIALRVKVKLKIPIANHLNINGKSWNGQQIEFSSG